VKKLTAAVVLIALCAIALGLSSCGSSSEGKEGGTLKATYASIDYLDPALSYTQEGLSAMYDTYIPLLTYAHANGAEGGEVVPGLAESMPKVTNGGKTYALQLRKGLKYSDGSPVKASDFERAIERTLGLNSQGSVSYFGIVGAEEFAKTKSGGISGIEANDKTGKITVELTAPSGSFTNALGLLFAAPVPGDTPMKNLTADPPPATGPYMIAKSEPGRAWSYARNPQWANNNADLVPEVPDGHLDKIDVKIVSNPSTQVNEVERGSSNWMQTTIPSDLYGKVKEKYEGSQFRVEPTISNYFFWMNTQRPPFDDLKVRQAVNYALNGEAMERIYATSRSRSTPTTSRRRRSWSPKQTRATAASRSGPTTKARTTKPAPTTKAC
jgi:peptide/nickel transport system substrate-binding protein